MGQPDVTSNFSNTANQLSAASTVAPTASVRLSLKPNGFPRGTFDGAWWPRSTDPAVELPALIEALGAQRVPIRRIALIMAGWDSAPRRIRLDSGRKVAVEWFPTGDVRMIRTVDINDQRIDLLNIPVDTQQAIAHLALTMATDGKDPDITATVSPHSAPGASLGNEGGVPDHRGQDRVPSTQPSDVIGRQPIVLLPHGSS